MRVVFAIALFVSLPFAVLAQPVRVQTGEHADFSRVVVRLPMGADWVFGRDTNGYVLRLPVADGYDLRRFYDLIPNTRIMAVSQDAAAGELRLAVSCECNADVLQISPRFLVIDIGDGAADEASPFEKFIDRDTGSLRPENAGKRIFPVVFPDVTTAGPTSSVPLLPFARPSVPRQPSAPVIRTELAALEQLVVESLGRGMTDGVLVPDLTRTVIGPNSAAQISTDLPVPGISVSSGIDPVALPGEAPPPLAENGMACIPDSFVDLAAWADDRPFGDQIAEKRSLLVQEFDRFDPEVVLGLARVYTHFGFGREAIQTLELDNMGSVERTYLRTIAQILDDEPGVFSDLHGQASCPSSVALWAFLAAPIDSPARDGNRAAILRTFNSIPRLLQRHLGPRLAERFDAIGDDDAADQALRVARREAPDAVATRLAAATLATSLGNDTAQMATLTILARTEPRITPEAMIRFLVESARRQIAVPASDMVMADVLRFEHAQTPTSADIAAAQIAAYLAVDAFEDAIRLFEETGSVFDAALRDTINAEIDQAAVARMSDADFLGYFLGKPLPLNTQELRDSVAGRLISLGFPDQALRLLGPSTPGQAEEKADHLRAVALINLNDPDAALRLLRDDPAVRAAELRAAARSVRAGNVAPMLNDGSSDGTAWRSGNWASLAQSEDPLMRETGAALLNADNPIFDQQSPLASGRALLDDAAQSRVLLDDLFERFMPPEDF